MYKGIEYESGLLGSYQAYNASLAIEAIKLINPNIEYDLINYALKHSKWPGRMEIISNNPLIIIDGGHNIHAIKNTVDYLSNIKENKNIKVVFTSLMDKDYNSMLNELDKIAYSYYFTSLNDIRKTDPNLFIGNRTNYKIILNTDECITKAIEELGNNDILFITGSLHFISYIRKKLKNIF